jgi:glycosyltransferase involved in cell wall biosynthesis
MALQAVSGSYRNYRSYKFFQSEINSLFPYKIYPVDSNIFSDSIWRILFSESMGSNDITILRDSDFYVSEYDLALLLERRWLSPIIKPRLVTEGFDFFVTSDPRPVRVSRGTIKVTKYHDAIPLLHPDTHDNSHPRHHHRLTYRSRKDSIFVCNSVPTEQQLIQLFPSVIGRTTTIANALSGIDSGASQRLSAADIVKSKLTLISIRENKTERLRQRILDKTNLGEKFRYIIALSTLEPRKNFTSVIRAWERVRFRTGEDIKLVIVGKPGWNFGEIFAAIKPRLLDGKLLHVQDLSQAEVQALYRGADLLVSPSFAEGFGFPPMEALQFGTPSVVYDIAAHRWVMEDSVLYCDPYDVEDIAEKIELLIVAKDSGARKKRLLKNGKRVLDRYSMDVISAQWDDLFQRLKRGEGPISQVN